jgi:hypothetical protein
MSMLSFFSWHSVTYDVGRASLNEQLMEMYAQRNNCGAFDIMAFVNATSGRSEAHPASCPKGGGKASGSWR